MRSVLHQQSNVSLHRSNILFQRIKRCWQGIQLIQAMLIISSDVRRSRQKVSDSFGVFGTAETGFWKAAQKSCLSRWPPNILLRVPLFAECRNKSKDDVAVQPQIKLPKRVSSLSRIHWHPSKETESPETNKQENGFQPNCVHTKQTHTHTRAQTHSSGRGTDANMCVQSNHSRISVASHRSERKNIDNHFAFIMQICRVRRNPKQNKCPERRKPYEKRNWKWALQVFI